MATYKTLPCSLETAKKLIEIKSARQARLLARYDRPFTKVNFENAHSIGAVMLEEARCAKKFWREFSSLLSKTGFTGRHARSSDPVNHLLDIGYHHLTNETKKILEKYDIPMALGVLHSPRTAKSAPLAYDLVEMFRSDIVDAEVLKFFRLKKKLPIEVSNDSIPYFLHDINERLNRKFYLKDFKQCHTYLYYMELQILKFIKAVNHKEVFMPIYLPSRHESRCSVKT